MSWNRTRLEVKQPSYLLPGLAMLALGVVAVAFVLAALSPGPSDAERRRIDEEQQQQHSITMLWQPWRTAAESVALIALCGTAPLALLLGSIAAKRAIDAKWPQGEDPDDDVTAPHDGDQPDPGGIPGPRPSSAPSTTPTRSPWTPSRGAPRRWRRARARARQTLPTSSDRSLVEAMLESGGAVAIGSGRLPPTCAMALAMREYGPGILGRPQTPGRVHVERMTPVAALPWEERPSRSHLSSYSVRYADVAVIALAETVHYRPPAASQRARDPRPGGMRPVVLAPVGSRDRSTRP
jgi:hypothetical protein